MPLLAAADLAPGPLTPEQALAQAEALVASAICPGLPGLSECTWELRVRLHPEPHAFGVPGFGRRRLGPDVLRCWPITGLVSVAQAGVDLTAECTFDAFSIRRDAQAPEFGAVGMLNVVFRTGWSAGTLPDAVRQAVLTTASGLLDAGPAGIKSEKIEDYAVTYDTEGRGALPPAALALLRPWQVRL